MDIQARIGALSTSAGPTVLFSGLRTTSSWWCSPTFYNSRSCPSPLLLLPPPPSCSRRDDNNNSRDPKRDGDSTDDKFSTDWDKAWTNFKKRGKKNIFSKFSPNKYVSWNPRRSDYPLSEEVDPIKRTERSNLMLWTSPRFTLVGAIVILTFLLIYTILAPVK